METITKIINEWDPIRFFPMAPKNEYVIEIEKIHEYILKNQNLQIRTLAEEINKIFVQAFGADVYDENIDQCILVAEKILKNEKDSRRAYDNCHA